ncbi:two component transcriptional regulator, LytTR family [Lutibacter oricola]|uniref:Two component transcriptional regulator, LytTR family n=1 Tax=Lutibacter oricola TaxID=762486 RepID=A0A1H2T4T6_9FLAO|nr:LytTR family DNA-binding domain-containing protein [Lutibacter oricola]SDW38830.1 two component transcriptional regulator, LytTR family [Lutibacter oricola]
MMKCLIIDDEPLAIELLEDFVSKVSFLELVKSCSSAFEAMEAIQTEKIDLIFSDIEMPDFTGIEFIKSLEQKPLIIFTTAYSHYAVEGFNLNAVDYLVKPIPFHRFIKAVNRAQELFNLKLEQEETVVAIPEVVKPKVDFIFVKSEYENVKVNLSKVKYIEGLKDYIKIYTDKPNPILTLNSLKAFEDKLPTNFVRVHRSFIVSLDYIDSVQRNRIVIEKVRVPIGQNYKDEFLKRIES